MKEKQCIILRGGGNSYNKKKFKVRNYPIIVFLLLLSLSGRSQEKENFKLFTDRDVYISGETLLLKVYAPSDERSKVVSVDLINFIGKKITGINLETNENQSNGTIYLPDSLSSGTYILHTFSRSETTHTLKEIYVANRFSGVTETNTLTRPSGEKPENDLKLSTLQIDKIEKSYKKRENGFVELNLPKDLSERLKGNLDVSIAKIIPDYNSDSFIFHTKQNLAQGNNKEGIIIEGIVIDKKTSQPFKNAVVTLSIPDSLPVFRYYITKSDGHFFFQLKNYYGLITSVLQCYDKTKNQPLKIIIKNDSSLQGSLQTLGAGSLSPGIRKVISRDIEAVTIRKIFNHQYIKLLPLNPHKKESYPFYGVPNNIVYPRLFLDLADFTEISRELLPGVRFRTNSRIPSLQLLNSGSAQYFIDQPLVILDGIPIMDLNAIKDLNSKKIDRIEICLNERFYGDLSFSGVLAIYTNSPDISRYGESDELVRYTMNGIQPKSTLNPPPDQLSTEPDLRNVILWEPSVIPKPYLQFNFRTSDITGKYRLIIRGKGTDGSIIYNEKTFEVN